MTFMRIFQTSNIWPDAVLTVMAGLLIAPH